MIDFKLNGKSISIPSSYDDFTMRQFIAISKPDNDMNSVLSILTGVPHETLKKAVIIGLEEILISLQFLKKPPVWGEVMPDHIGKYKLPLNHKGQFNIQFESLGQFEDMRSDFKEIEDTLALTQAYPKICARYLQKIRDGEYNPEKAEQMVEEVLDLPAKEVVVLGSFFYVKLMSLLTGTQSNSQNTPQNPKKSKQGSKSSKKTSGSTLQSTTSPLRSGSRKK